METCFRLCGYAALIAALAGAGPAPDLPVTVAMEPPDGAFQAGSRQDFTLTVTTVSPLPAGSEFRIIPPVRRLWSLPVAAPPANDWGVEARVVWEFARDDGPAC